MSSAEISSDEKSSAEMSSAETSTDISLPGISCPKTSFAEKSFTVENFLARSAFDTITVLPTPMAAPSTPSVSILAQKLVNINPKMTWLQCTFLGLCGIFIFILEAVRCAAYQYYERHPYPFNLYYGLWSGGLIILNSAIGCLCARNKTRAMVILYLALTIICSGLVTPFVLGVTCYELSHGASALNCKDYFFDEPWNYFCSSPYLDETKYPDYDPNYDNAYGYEYANDYPPPRHQAYNEVDCFRQPFIIGSTICIFLTAMVALAIYVKIGIGFLKAKNNKNKETLDTGSSSSTLSSLPPPYQIPPPPYEA